MNEDELIASFIPYLPKAKDVIVPTGDDCAVLPGRGDTAVSIDMLVEDRHFKRAWSTGADVGYRAAQQNLADAVAMGARPTSLVVGLGLPGDLDAEWVSDFARGLAEACEPLGVGVDGGDLVGSDAIVVSVTVLGSMEGRAPVRRSGASPQDLVVFAGNLGHGVAGYSLLEAGFDRTIDDPALAALIDDFLRPKPPLGIALAAAESFTSLMDVSDGLVRDARRIAKASGMAIDLDKKAIERRMGDLGKAAGRVRADRREWLFTGEEDHGFIGTIHPDTPVPAGFEVIGKVGGPYHLGKLTVGGREVAEGGGWDHFRKS